jgi:hypothetical protein
LPLCFKIAHETDANMPTAAILKMISIDTPMVMFFKEAISQMQFRR